MKTQTWLNKLRKQLGSWEKVASQLGITERHLYNVRMGRHTGRWLKEAIANRARGA